MHFRKPELVPLLFIIASTVMLGTLGTWQLQRLAWKNSLITTIAEAQAQPELKQLPENLAPLAYRSVTVSGHFQNDKMLRLVGRKQNMGAGFFLLTPFTLSDGRTILVNRGYAEEGKENPLAGRQEIHGILRPPREKRYFSPENQSQKNLWFYEDIPAISALTGLEIEPVVIEAVGTGHPVPSDGKIALRNDHLGYAFTWFSLALVGLIMFGFYHRIPQNKA